MRPNNCAIGALCACLVVLSGPLAIAARPDKSGPALVRLVDAVAARPEDSSTRLIIDLDRPLRPGDREALAAAGVRIVGFRSDRSLIITIHHARFDAGTVARVGGLADVRPLVPEDRLHALLREPAIPPEVVRDPREADRALVYVLFHEGTVPAQAHKLIARHRARAESSFMGSRGFLVSASTDAIAALALEDAVLMIEPALPALGPFNAENRAVTGVDILHSIEGLGGAGVNVLLYDTGRPHLHPDFSGAMSEPRFFVRDFSSLSPHATHVGGTIAASGLVSGGLQRGMAPEALVQAYGVAFGGVLDPFVTDLGNVEASYADAIHNHSVAIANNSIGINLAAAGGPCSLEGYYGVFSAFVDGIVRGGLGRPICVVWAAGNERGNGFCGTGFDTLPPPVTAKNPICVGALNADDLSVTGFTSWGPTDDGRIKPDLVAPGCQITGDGGVTSTWIDNGYFALCGTSMAAPTVTGIGALLIERYRQMYPDRPDMLNATLKALLINSALDVADPGPDMMTGWGLVDAAAAAALLDSGSLREGLIDSTTESHFTVDVPPGTPELNLTLAWDDPPALPGAVPTLINDLDLEAVSPGGAIYRGNWFVGAYSAPNGSPDRLNNAERFRINGPESGQWQIIVRGYSVPDGPQSFGIVSNVPLVGLTVRIESAIPQIIPPQKPFELIVRVMGMGNSDLSAQSRLMHRADGGSFEPLLLTWLGGERYRAVIPAPACDDSPDYYISILDGEATDPPAAPHSFHTSFVGVRETIFFDDFETDQGWLGAAPGDTATSGHWVRAEPIGTIAQPAADHTPPPGTHCWITGQGSIGGPAGEADVDNGYTTLTSPLIDLTGAIEARISFALWYHNAAGNNPNVDTLTVDFTDDGTNWTNALTLGPSGPRTFGGWFLYDFAIEDFVPPTSQFRMRVITRDEGPPSLVEAALDDVRITGFVCPAAPIGCPGDVDGSGNIDVDDVAYVVLRLGATGPPDGSLPGDADGSGQVDVDDIAFVVLRLGEGCGR